MLKRITKIVGLPDDFNPCYSGCEKSCPFGIKSRFKSFEEDVLEQDTAKCKLQCQCPFELVDGWTCEDIKEAHLIEYRRDSGDYPELAYRCSNCSNEVYDDDIYCSGCGVKFTGEIEEIPASKCKECCYSYTGLIEDCHRGKCKYNEAEDEEYDLYRRLKEKYEGNGK